MSVRQLLDTNNYEIECTTLDVSDNVNIGGNLGIMSDITANRATIDTINTVKVAGQKIYLSDPFITLGDSFTAGGAWSPTWNFYLSILTGKANENRAVSGKTSDYSTTTGSITNDLILNPLYNQHSTIIMYGFNDLRNNKALYSNFYAWTQNILSLTLTCAVPANLIDDMRTGWTQSGTWLNTPVYNFGIYTDMMSNYVEKTFTRSVRYIGVRHTIYAGNNTSWTLSVNGGVVNTFTYTIDTIACESATYRTGAYIVDLGSDFVNPTIRLTKGASNWTNTYTDFVACWTSADLVGNPRSVLLLSIPRFNYQYTGGSPFDQPTEEKRRMMNEGYKQVAESCRLMGLNVSYYKIANMMGNFHTDNIHPAPTQSNVWANEIYNNAIIH